MQLPALSYIIWKALQLKSIFVRSLADKGIGERSRLWTALPARAEAGPVASLFNLIDLY